MANIEIMFLGTGSAFSKNFGNTSAVVNVYEDGQKQNLLIDCGRTTPDNLHRAGLTWRDIDAIFITHLHGDHVFGLEEAGFVGRYVLKKKPHLILPSKKMKNDLWDKVLKGTMANGDLDRMMNFEDYFTYDYVDLEQPFFIFNHTMFSVYPTKHIKNKKSYGLFIGESNYVMYSGDSLLQEDLILMAVDDGCQFIFHDCQLFDNEGKVHASLDDLKGLEENIRSRMAIMHYGDNLHEHYIDIIKHGMSVAVPRSVYNFKVN
jgi:hydroxyacylglutathione hydrolase